MAKTTPYSEGNPKEAQIIFIGEAPSNEEIVAGRPFIGPAGRIFDNSLHHAGIARANCYITNVFSSPLDKGRDNLPKGVWDIPEDDYFRIIDLFKTIRKDAIVVPLGNTALHLICEQKEITKYRGTPTPCTFEKFTPQCIPTLHPASALRYRGNPIWQYFIISDLKKIKRWSEGGGGIPSRDYYISPTTEQALNWLERMSHEEIVAYDIEIWNNQISCISFAPNPWECMSIPLIDMFKPNRSYFSPQNEARIWKAISKVLYAENIKIGQNLMFDASWMLHFHNCLTRGKIYDTMLAHHIMYPDFPKGLDFLASIYTDEPYYKEDRKLWKKLGVDQERFWLYNAKDSAITFAVWEEIKEELWRDYAQTYQMTIDLFYPLLYMTERGIKINRDSLAETKVKISAELDKKREELREVSEWDFNPNSPKQCQEYFYITKGIKPYLNRQTGRPSCDDKALQRLATTHQLKEASIVQELRYLKKLLSTYLDVELDPDGRMRCTWNSRGTYGGRLSSSKTLWGSGLNFQNLHPEFRHFVIPE